MIVLMLNLSIAKASDWKIQVDSVYSMGSVLTYDVNNDGIKDVILPKGYEDTSFHMVSGVMALDGLDGHKLWDLRRRFDIYGTGKELDVNQDGKNDLIFVGRLGELFALDMQNGNLLWEFLDTKRFYPKDSGWFNFYDPQIIDDMNSDGVKDLVVTNGGNAEAGAGDSVNRYPGYLMLISGSNGKEIAKLRTPDFKETYMSPVVHNFINNEQYVLLGTGGETLYGNFWAIRLGDLIRMDSTKFIKILPGANKGYITAPSLADLNSDNELDIIVTGFDGEITAINGTDFSVLWQKEFLGYEVYTSAAIGLINSDSVPDIALSLGFGLFSDYSHTLHILIDGTNGEIIDSLITIGDFTLSSPIIGNFDADINDEVLFTTNYAFHGFEKSLFNSYDFNNHTWSVMDSVNNGFLFTQTPLFDNVDNDMYMDFVFAETQNFASHNDVLTNIKVSKKSYPTIKTFIPNWSQFYGLKRDCKYYNNVYTNVKINESELSKFTCRYANHMIYFNYLNFNSDLQLTIHTLSGKLVAKIPLLNTDHLNYYLNDGIYILTLTGYGYIQSEKLNVKN